MTRTALVAAFFAGLAVTSPAAALAAPAGRVAVNYADLDLSRPADVARLRRRISAALDEVCDSHASAESAADDEISRCRAEGRAEAEEQLAHILNRAVQMAQAGAARAPR
jgi:UrcA family protein